MLFALWHFRVRLQGASARYYCQSYRLLLSECSVRFEAWVPVSLQGVAARCCWQALGLIESVFLPQQIFGERLVATKQSLISFAVAHAGNLV